MPMIKMTEDERILRELLWRHHGCKWEALCGDDGEMRCNQCGADFKRMPAHELQIFFIKKSVQRDDFTPLKQWLATV